MWVRFENLPVDARLWIYQANRKLIAAEHTMIEQALREFCDQWKAHGNDLQTSFSIRYNQFILFSVDESRAGASGCSIDGSVRYLKAIQQQTGIDFFDRTRVGFWDNDEVVTYKMTELKELFLSGKLSGTSITFNNAITTKGELETNWKILAENSWLVKYLPKPALQN